MTNDLKTSNQTSPLMHVLAVPKFSDNIFATKENKA